MRLSHGLLLIVILCSCSKDYNRKELEKVLANFTDETAAKLATEILATSSDWWLGVSDKNKIQTGVVKFSDGKMAKFAFLSHHISLDRESHTLFRINGRVKHFTGYFCCEIMFSDPQPKDSIEFEKLLEKYEGTSP